jgi:hypothetical protein
MFGSMTPDTSYASACNFFRHSLRVIAVCAMNATMRGGAVTVLLAITALAAYAVGRQDAPANQPPAAPAAIARSTAQPVAFTTTTVEQATSAPKSTPGPEQKCQRR